MKDLWGEGRWIDMWSLVHLMSGVFLGSVFYLLDISLGWSFTIVSILFIGWELLEYVWKWEKLSNHVSDFVVNYAGYGIFYLIYYVWDKPFSTPVFILVNGIFLILNLWGFSAYKRRKNRS